MRRAAVPLCGLALLALAVAAGACSGSGAGSKGSGGSCTPPPAHNITYNFTLKNAQPVAGHIAALRFVQNNQLIFGCTTALVPASGSWSATGGAFGPVGPNLELILNSGAEAVFGPGDQHYTLQLGVDGAIVGDPCAVNLAWNVTLDYATAAQSPVLWEQGFACPGVAPTPTP